MKTVIIDIETAGEDFELLDKTSQDYFLRFADTPQKTEEAKRSTSFYPLTAQIVAIGMLDVDSEQGAVYFQNPGGIYKDKQDSIHFISGTEREILEHFWRQMGRFEQIVTFNGRVFDCPFLMLRSAKHGIAITKNLVPYRYSHSLHIDLADQLTFYDAMRRNFSLHMWCRFFGIPSPKEEGMTGLQVKDFFKAGRNLEIAQYCFKDLLATKQIYQYWEKYVRQAG